MIPFNFFRCYCESSTHELLRVIVVRRRIREFQRSQRESRNKGRQPAWKRARERPQCTFSKEHNLMLRTESGRMFYFNSFPIHPNPYSRKRKQGSEKTTERRIAKNTIERESWRIKKHLRTQQATQQSSVSR